MVCGVQLYRVLTRRLPQRSRLMSVLHEWNSSSPKCRPSLRGSRRVSRSLCLLFRFDIRLPL